MPDVRVASAASERHSGMPRGRAIGWRGGAALVGRTAVSLPVPRKCGRSETLRYYAEEGYCQC